MTTSPDAAVLTIGGAAAAAGVSVDTVRYYDRVGLLEDLQRDAAGNRRFTSADLGWLRLLRCLRDTGMSIEDLRRFCALDPAVAAQQRLRLLEEHQEAVRARIRRTERELDVVAGKIAAYRALVDGETTTVQVETAEVQQ